MLFIRIYRKSLSQFLGTLFRIIFGKKHLHYKTLYRAPCHIYTYMYIYMYIENTKHLEWINFIMTYRRVFGMDCVYSILCISVLLYILYRSSNSSSTTAEHYVWKWNKWAYSSNGRVGYNFIFLLCYSSFRSIVHLFIFVSSLFYHFFHLLFFAFLFVRFGLDLWVHLLLSAHSFALNWLPLEQTVSFISRDEHILNFTGFLTGLNKIYNIFSYYMLQQRLCCHNVLQYVQDETKPRIMPIRITD